MRREPKKTVKASIIGVTGYTGLELLRLLLGHPQVELAHITSRQDEGAKIGDLYPHLSHLGLKLSNPPLDTVAADSDVVFLALPHKTAQEPVAALHGKVKVIDLSADYRLDDAEIYKKHYGLDHNYPELVGDVVYGAPEINRDAIKTASTVANPGCFALLAQLMLLPFAGLMECADLMAITGSSGAGKSPAEGTHHPVRSHTMKSYNINTHRHIPEIIRTARLPENRLNFVPTSGPFVRGIFATAYIQPKDGAKLPDAAEFYAAEPFVRVRKNVALADIVGSNFCDLSYTQGHEVIIAQGALDNLVKGAAGCAVQNMNLMCGFAETAGLNVFSPVYP